MFDIRYYIVYAPCGTLLLQKVMHYKSFSSDYLGGQSANTIFTVKSVMYFNTLVNIVSQ